MTTVITRGQEFFRKMKREVSERILEQGLNLITRTKNYQLLAGIFDRIANTEQQKMIAAWFQSWLAEGNPGVPYLTRVFNQLHPNLRKKYIVQFVVNSFFRNVYSWSRFREENGFNPPAVLLISPSMRCNYKCQGCYAANYTKKDDMSPQLLDRVITEAKEIGTRYFVILGGEPFLYGPLLEIYQKHNDVSFQVYTNGSLIDQEMAERLVKLGNVAPQISLEGFKKESDARRGEGAFAKAMQAMDNLREAGCIFAFSTVPTRKNIEAITSDEFIDLMIEKGALYGWYFLYMPVGGNSDLSDLPTPEERNKLRLAVNRFRKTKPILVADFWNDAPLIGGCIAGGRIYLHINHKGDVEPCIFVHYATHNINNCSLAEALKSPFFAGMRKMQPFGYNTLRPCQIIDHPQIMRMAIKRWGAYPTHPGAEEAYTGKIAEHLDRYSREVARLYDPIFQDEYVPWVEKWMKIMDFPEKRIEARKAGYSAKRKRG